MVKRSHFIHTISIFTKVQMLFVFVSEMQTRCQCQLYVDVMKWAAPKGVKGGAFEIKASEIKLTKITHISLKIVVY